MSLDFYLMVPDETAPDGQRYVFGENATHNLTPMWREACVYDALYMSDGRPAWSQIATLMLGVLTMIVYPDTFKALEPANGWGNYEGALEFLQNVCQACVSNPEAIIHISK